LEAPSASVTVPRLLPLMIMFTPGIPTPSVCDVTFPDTTLSAARSGSTFARATAGIMISATITQNRPLTLVCIILFILCGLYIFFDSGRHVLHLQWCVSVGNAIFPRLVRYRSDDAILERS